MNYYIHLTREPRQYEVRVARNKTSPRSRMELVEGPYVFSRPSEREEMVTKVHELGKFYRSKGAVEVVTEDL